MAIEKIKILWAFLELPAKQNLDQFLREIGWIGSSKTAPRILIFSIDLGAYYSYELKNSEI